MTRFIRHHRTTRRWLVSVVTAGAVIVSMVAIRAQADQFQLFVVASDANGAPVNDLKVEDVSMAESGMPGKVLTVERANLPIKLYDGMKIGQISFQRLSSPVEVGYGDARIGSKYRGQTDPTASLYHADFDRGRVVR